VIVLTGFFLDALWFHWLITKPAEFVLHFFTGPQASTALRVCNRPLRSPKMKAGRDVPPWRLSLHVQASQHRGMSPAGCPKFVMQQNQL
jgi:hypothetical protein